MKVELLHIACCPNAEATRKLLKETLRELGRVEEVSEMEVSDVAQAQALRFPGSPTVRVNDTDVETPRPAETLNGLSCRMYMIDGRLHGLPSREMLRSAILAVSSTERK